MKRLIAVLLAFAMLLVLAACGETAPEPTEPETRPTTTPTEGPTTAPTEPPAPKVGVTVPTRDLPRWKQDGENLKKALEELGCDVELAYAQNEVPAQAAQIESMIESGCKVLIIAAVEGNSLGSVLEKAKEHGVTVIAYDRLLMDTPDVDYFVDLDLSKLGTVQAQYIADVLDLEHAEGPFNIELVAGDPGDSNGLVIYVHTMSALRSYIESGKLVIRSGQDRYDQCATPYPNPENAGSRIEQILEEFYQKEPLHAVICGSDSTAQAVIQALEAGYPRGDWPVIVGMTDDYGGGSWQITSLENMLAGKQAMTVFWDTRVLVDRAVRMTESILKGEAVEVNDTDSYNNGVYAVPSYLCDPVVVTAENYREYLLGSGYYTEADLAE